MGSAILNLNQQSHLYQLILLIPQLAITLTTLSAVVLILILNPEDVLVMFPFLLFLGAYWIKRIFIKEDI
ncbi:MAG: hypothetical protein ACW99Q_17770 [Candidatus Kariarchaeaceae archaeon]